MEPQSPRRQPASVVVIIPALRRPDLTGLCLRSLALQTANGAEIVVVENEARSNMVFNVEVLPSTFPYPVRRILLEQNLGTTDSANRALAESSSEFVLLLNNDIELDSQYIARLTEKLKAESLLAFVTGKLLNARERNRLDGAGDALLLGGGAYRLGHEDIDGGQFDHPSAVFAGCGAATLYRRSALEDVGGMDGDFFAYLDDVDLAFRLRLRGWEGAYEPTAIAYHIGSATLGDPMHPRIAQWMTRNQLLLLLKNYPAGVALRLLPRICVYEFLWFLMTVHGGKIISYLRGLLEAVKLLPRVARKRQLVQSQRKVTNQELMKALRNSEAQINAWHAGRDAKSRSLLLRMYFGLFGRP